MICGEWPCCDGPLFIEVPDGPLPVFCKNECEHCGRTCWHRISKWNPESWTEEDFPKEILDNLNKVTDEDRAKWQAEQDRLSSLSLPELIKAYRDAAAKEVEKIPWKVVRRMEEA